VVPKKLDKTGVINIGVFGESNAGKSQLVCLRFINDSFNDDYDPTIEDSYRKQACVLSSCGVLSYLVIAFLLLLLTFLDYSQGWI
jgi:hypothetical protein